VTAADLVERLTMHKTVGGAPRRELEWLAAHGTLRQLPEGDIVSAKGVPVAGLFVVLTGHIAIFVDRGAGRHKVLEWRAGDVAGMLPYSRLVTPPGDSVAQEASEILAIPREDLTEMIRECHEITSILVHKMLDRSRTFTSSELQDERLVSLGRLSAGLAHELNNPTAAIERNAALLGSRLDEAEQATRAVDACRLTDREVTAIDRLRASCAKAADATLSPIQRAQREEAIGDWLSDHGVADAITESLSDTAVSVEELDQVAAAVNGSNLDAVLRWVATGCAVRRIASELQEAATRITGLVSAVKGFTHMDQASVAEPVDLMSSLRNTVAVLNAKAKTKSIIVTVDVEPNLPRVQGFVGELNQIWANLIDNALDAAPDAGRVDVTARHEGDRVVVRIIDNGPGISPEIRGHLFEPFFTTKPVGKGTGLGLDIVRRLIVHNDAGIEVDSAPGRTEFRVLLPLAKSAAAGERS
jgi:signal transduction histidine kinase